MSAPALYSQSLGVGGEKSVRTRGLNSRRNFAKLAELSREMLNDWEAIIRPLLDLSLPLTNNAAERLLRHWVIARHLSFGTRGEQGTRAFALLSSIIDTEGVRLRLPHRRPPGRPPGTTDAAFAYRLDRE
ncbi:MAG TPA: transposase [Accumulibacter sp.]|nr:transposase [Accumulibacter sp.]